MLKFYVDVASKSIVNRKKFTIHAMFWLYSTPHEKGFFFRGDMFLSFLNAIRATQSKLRYLNLSNFTANTI